MKTIKYYVILSLISVLLFSCSKNETSNTITNPVNESLKEGAWTVTYYSDKGKDETYKFNGYSLIFKENDVFELSTSRQSLIGTWSYEYHSDDGNDSPNKLIIQVSGNDIADELQDDWIVTGSTDNKISLQDDGVDHTELLTLQRKP